MLKAIMDHIKEVSNAAGSKGFETNEEALSKTRSTPFVVFLPGRESYEKDGSVVAEELIEDEDRKVKRIRLFKRLIRIDIAMVSNSLPAADEFMQQVVAGLERRIFDSGGNAITLEVAGGEWIPSDGLLKGNGGYMLFLHCSGGLHVDKEIPIVYLGEVDVEFDNELEESEV